MIVHKLPMIDKGIHPALQRASDATTQIVHNYFKHPLLATMATSPQTVTTSEADSNQQEAGRTTYSLL